MSEKNMHIIILRALEHRLRYDEFRCRWDLVRQVCAALKRPVISKCQYSAKFGNTVHVNFSHIRISLLARKIRHLENIET